MSFRLPFRPCVAALGVLTLVATVAVATPPAGAAAQEPTFSDLDQTIHAEAIELVAADGIAGGFPDGTFRPRNDVRRDQMATFLANALRLDEVPSTFPDVPEASPHFGRIGAIAAADITRGFPDGTYRPLGYVTRGQMARFLAEGFDLPAGDETFDDVPANYVHADAIAALASSGITAGYPDGTFRPNLLVKRDQMARFLANAVPLPREPDPVPEPEACPPQASSGPSSIERQAPAGPQRAPEPGGGSEDLAELEAADVASTIDAAAVAEGTVAVTEDLGPAIPGIDYPTTTAVRTSPDSLETFTQDINPSRATRVDGDGSISRTITAPGTRTWATAVVGDHVYIGQWGPAVRPSPGQTPPPNLFRYPIAGTDGGQATPVAAIPVGGEFWSLTADGDGRLWAGSRAHNDATLRQQVGLRADGRDDPRHVVHRVEPDSGRVAPVLFCAPDLPTTGVGARPDVKQVAAAGDDLYVGLGQQPGGARLYRFTPGDRTEVPLTDVVDLTPAGVRGATSIFALRADDRYVAFGTQTGTNEATRLVVLDRTDRHRVRVNVPLPGEVRIDAVTISGSRVAATGFSGALYEVLVPGSGTLTAATRHDPPVPGQQFHRFVEFQAGGALGGVTNRGIVWTRDADGTVQTDNLVDAGAVATPGLPHSMHAGSADVAVGSTSAVTLRDAADPTAGSRTVAIAGEAKAITSDPDGDTYIASYPNAQLWSVEAGADAATALRGWDTAFTRPAAADFDARTGQVLVVAREEAAPQSESRVGTPQANFQWRPSRLFAIDPTSEETTRVVGVPLGRAGTGDALVTVEASAVLAGASPGGAEIFVGDTRGGVQRTDAGTGQRAWYRDARVEDRYRPVVDISLVDDHLVVTRGGALAARDGSGLYDPRTSVAVLDPATGQELEHHVVPEQPLAGGTTEPFGAATAVTSGDVTVMPFRTFLRFFDRSTGELTWTRHATNASWGGPYVALTEDCTLYTLERSPSHLVRSPFSLGDCAPEDPEDQTPGDPPSDPGDPGTDR